MDEPNPMDELEQIAAEIEQWMQTALQVRELPDRDENLFTTGVLDSMGIMRLIQHLEERCGVRVPPGDMVPEYFRSVEAMAGTFVRLRAD